ncbi:MAG: dUTP diphosphatase [Clostridiales bacterium]|nr:dUTP diphosphatase [Clostridiales bacterium]
MEYMKVKKLSENAVVPVRATPGSAGMDLYACLEKPVTLKKGENAVVPTGIAIELPSDSLVAYIFARSGLAVKHGITLANCVGVIDSDYRGEIKVGLVNLYNEEYTINSGERIAQLVVSPVSLITPVEADELGETGRGAGGFGSTGK